MEVGGGGRAMYSHRCIANGRGHRCHTSRLWHAGGTAGIEHVAIVVGT